MNYNRVIIGGHLTRDPELKNLPNGTAVCDFGIANNERWKSKDGEQQERVCFVDVSCFGPRAEVIAKYFSKGKPILIEGKLRYDSWEAKDGGKRNKLSVTMDNFVFVGPKAGGDDNPDDLPF